MMSLFSEMQSAATEAQSNLAQITGTPDPATPNVLYNGETYIGVFGLPSPMEFPNLGGGFRKKTVVRLTLTRTQFTKAPVSQETLTRTDLSIPLGYRIAIVDTHDPLHYVLTLVLVGPDSPPP